MGTEVTLWYVVQRQHLRCPEVVTLPSSRINVGEMRAELHSKTSIHPSLQIVTMHGKGNKGRMLYDETMCDNHVLCLEEGSTLYISPLTVNVWSSFLDMELVFHPQAGVWVKKEKEESSRDVAISSEGHANRKRACSSSSSSSLPAKNKKEPNPKRNKGNTTNDTTSAPLLSAEDSARLAKEEVTDVDEDEVLDASPSDDEEGNTIAEEVEKVMEFLIETVHATCDEPKGTVSLFAKRSGLLS